MSTQNPAWPHRPPIGTTLALCLSLVLGAAYCFATVRFTPGLPGRLLPVYIKASLWSLVPNLNFRTHHAARATAVPARQFRFPDGSTLAMSSPKLKLSLRNRIYGGKSLLILFEPALIGFGVTLLTLVFIGASCDRTYETASRNGRHIRGPRLVSRARFNGGTRGRGLRFSLTFRPKFSERILAKFLGIKPRELAIPKRKESQHIQISGDTGAGKSTLIRSILYQIEERGDTAILFDPDREYIQEFYNSARGDIVLNPKDERCPYWPIGDEADDEAQATTIAMGLFPDAPTVQKFFLEHTRAIFAYLLAYYKPTTNELGHWMAHPEEIDKRVENTEHAHTMTANAAPQRAGILGSLNMAGKPLRMMPSHCEARPSFTIRAWARKRKGWIFVTSDPDTIDALRPLQSLWLDMLILKLQNSRSADEDAHRCWLVLDEVQQLQKLPQLPNALTKQRKSGNPIVLGFQGMSQIDNAYGKEAETMLSQAATNFVLRTKEKRAAEHLEGLLGKAQIERLRETKPSTGLLGSNKGGSWSTERVIEPLVLYSEIQTLPDLTGYFMHGDKVVKIEFPVPAQRHVAPGLIERMIPGVQTRPLILNTNAIPAQPEQEALSS